MTDIVQRIRTRPHDAPMPTEHLLDDAADELEKMRERVAQMQYEAGMYHSLYELAQTKSNDAYERGFCAGYDVCKMQNGGRT